MWGNRETHKEDAGGTPRAIPGDTPGCPPWDPTKDTPKDVLGDCLVVCFKNNFGGHIQIVFGAAFRRTPHPKIIGGAFGQPHR